MRILNENQIRQKIKRLAIEILENNADTRELILAGINNKGYEFAKHIQLELKSLHTIPISLTRIRLNPASPLDSEIKIDLPLDQLNKKVIVIVDDVANTGRTIFYALKPLLNILAKKIEVAVLVDRLHKSFPIHVDYVGLSLSTTMEENIEVEMSDQEWAVNLN